MTFKFTDSNFQVEALEANVPVLVDFYADWCGPCKMMGPVIDELAKDNEGTFKIGKINTDENPNTAKEYKVMTIPTMVIIQDGKEVDRIVGVVSKKDLQDKLDKIK